MQKLWQKIKAKRDIEISCVNPIDYFDRFNEGSSKLFRVKRNNSINNN